nr:hypothetical protein BaRGS_030838 [Batillaria attramentaria]
MDVFRSLDSVLKTGVSSARCYVDLATLRVALGVKTPWAVQMTDATFTLSGGFLEQEFDFLGVDDECLQTQVPPGIGFSARYCVIALISSSARIPSVLKPSDVTGLSVGACLPDSCEKKHISTIINQILKDKNLTGLLTFADVYFRSTNDVSFGGGAAGVLTFLSLWLLLLLSGTACDVVYTRSAKSRRRKRHRIQSVQHPTDQAVTVGGENVERDRDRNRDRETTEEGVKEVSDTDVDTSEAVSVATSRESEDSSATTSDLARTHTKRIRAALRGRRLASARENFRLVQLGSLIKLARCFSLYSNLPKLLDTSSAGTEITCLHGIRVISCAWVILVNTVFYKALYTRNALSLLKTMKDHTFPYAVFANGFLSLDSLFTLSGLLAGYAGCMRMASGRGQNNWLAFVLHRYGRITPTLVILGVAYLALFPHVTSGPLWTEHAPGYDDCRSWGWMNVFLIHNLAPAICLPWTWFFAVDFQLFLLAPLVLVVWNRNPRAAYILVLALVVACCVAGGLVTQYHHLPVSQYIIPDIFNTSGVNHTYITSTNINDFGRLYFYQAYAHAGSFLPPLLLGISLHTSNQRGSFRKRTVLVGWAGALSGMTIAVFSAKKELIDDNTSSVTSASLYNSLHRTLWSVCVCWVVLACSTGNGGPVNAMLSWRKWKPVSRLVFVAYLMHPIIILAHNACLQQLVYTTSLSMLYLYLGVLILSFKLSLLLTLTVEMPATALLHWLTDCCGRPVC